MKKELEKISKSSKEYADKAELKLNPDKKIRAFVLAGLAKRKIKFGEYYCPCRVVSGNKEEDKKKICPCFWHLDEIKKDGHCLCKLFFKK
ncbi:MAG: ferredoxin-thioredoxin reductase catalytic domain-containing protein [Nanoarchaeota archaeon]